MLMQYGEQDTIFSTSGGNNTPSGTGGMTGANIQTPPTPVLIPFGNPENLQNNTVNKIKLPTNKMDVLILFIVVIIVYKAFF